MVHAMKQLHFFGIILIIVLVVIGISRRGGPGDGAELSFVTEEYPPLTFSDENGEVAGLAAELVRDIMGQQGITSDITIGPWSEAYNRATSEPNIVIFSINRTPEREELFNWVGPIAKSSTVFYARADAGVSVATLEDAKQLAGIGAVDEWYSTQNLAAAGFTNLVPAATPDEAISQLVAGAVDVVPLTDITAADLVTQAGHDISELEPVFTMDTGYVYIGLSQGTPESVVSAWEQSLAELKTSGRFAEIYQDYFPETDITDLLEQ